jgi:hypothetical protein
LRTSARSRAVTPVFSRGGSRLAEWDKLSTVGFRGAALADVHLRHRSRGAANLEVLQCAQP